MKVESCVHASSLDTSRDRTNPPSPHFQTSTLIALPPAATFRRMRRITLSGEGVAGTKGKGGRGGGGEEEEEQRRGVRMQGREVTLLDRPQYVRWEGMRQHLSNISLCLYNIDRRAREDWWTTLPPPFSYSLSLSHLP